MSISRIYIGLPEALAKKVFWVQRKFRKNRKSHRPGGSDVIIEWSNGKAVGYDWIKDPSLYVEKIFRQKLNGVEVVDLETVRSEIVSVFARQYKNEGEYSTSCFQEVWNMQNSTQLPWEALHPFDLNRQASVSDEEDSWVEDPWQEFWDGLDDVARANVLNVMES